MTSIERSALAEGPDALPPDAGALTRLLVDRFSCRAFRPDPVTDALIDRMLTIAQLAPSWCNTQPWQVTITSGEATDRFRAALIADIDNPTPDTAPDIAFPAAYSGVRLERRREVGWQLYESAGIVKGDREASARQARENQRLFGAPHVLLIHTSRELGAYGAVDCGVYLGTLLLAAQSLGLGIIPQAALAHHSALIRRHFAVPDDQMFVVGASFGFAEMDSPVNRFRSRRAPLNDSVKKVSQ
ncbi:nitroreductase [Sphingobium sp. C100]|uniref:nitroreductase n=1 Tax=Sphingobium sp. C100 TaxID=1207055 RepID=UPI0003D68118|nr:nitroreductase [Sphingobium sp. C100]ETI65779.1 nitroreductase [Sphingobium sp. C100]